MKKISLFLFAFAMSVMAKAQTDGTFQFVDSLGNVIKDGSTITVSKVTGDGMGSLMISTGLFVRNTSSEKQGAGVNIRLSHMDNGSISVCHPNQCVPYERLGNFENPKGIIGPNETKPFITEWLPEKEGKCVATFTLERYEIVKDPLLDETAGKKKDS